MSERFIKIYICSAHESRQKFRLYNMPIKLFTTQQQAHKSFPHLIHYFFRLSIFRTLIAGKKEIIFFSQTTSLRYHIINLN